MPTKKKPSTTTAPYRHGFCMETVLGDKVHKYPVYAKVKYSKKPVPLTLEAEHVKKSIKSHGVGSTSACAMAVCSHSHGNCYPHPFVGILDWQPARAFVGSKVNKKGEPTECYVYEIDKPYRWISALNDTTGGQRKLLDMIEKNGPITITLSAHRQRSEPGRSGAGREKTGARKPAVYLRGHRARVARTGRASV